LEFLEHKMEQAYQKYLHILDVKAFENSDDHLRKVEADKRAAERSISYEEWLDLRETKPISDKILNPKPEPVQVSMHGDVSVSAWALSSLWQVSRVEDLNPLIQWMHGERQHEAGTQQQDNADSEFDKGTIIDGV